MNYYDAVLGLIPLSLGGVPAALSWVGITMSMAISVGALVSAGLIGHAMFVRTPVGRDVTADTPSDSEGAAQSNSGEYGTAD